jgi:uncharacterized protein with PQ loop repeat
MSIDLHLVSVITGYLASLLLAISLLVNNDLKFRWLNAFACVSFIIYGIIINAFPVTLTNSILLLINLVRLVQLYKKKEDFTIIEFQRGDKLVEKFVSFYSKDIHSFFPQFNLSDEGDNIRFIVLRDMVVSNIFIANVKEGNATVRINYTVPRYRDYKIGKFIFDKGKKYLLSHGVKTITYDQGYSDKYKIFFKKMGFTTKDKLYIKDL